MSTKNLPPVQAFSCVVPQELGGFGLYNLRLEYIDPVKQPIALSFQPSDALYLREFLTAALRELEPKVDKKVVHRRLEKVYRIPLRQSQNLWNRGEMLPSSLRRNTPDMSIESPPPLKKFRRLASLPMQVVPQEALEEAHQIRVEYDDPEGQSFGFSFQPSDALYLRALLNTVLRELEPKVDLEDVDRRLVKVYEIPLHQARRLWKV